MYCDSLLIETAKKEDRKSETEHGDPAAGRFMIEELRQRQAC
jgi:hypothetical protein